MIFCVILSTRLPCTEIEKHSAADGGALAKISEQLDYPPAQVPVIRTIRPKYARPCRRQEGQIAPVSAALFPNSAATQTLLAPITPATFVDGTPLYRREPPFARLGVSLSRATMPGRMIRLGGKQGVPTINLLTERLLEAPLIHSDETRLQVLDSDEAPAADHWKWVRATRVWEAICHPLEIEARRIGLNERPARSFHWHKAAGIR
jgi:transposase